MPASAEQLIGRFRVAVDLWAAGVALQRQRLLRLHPHASPRELDVLMDRWMQDRPGAKDGDGPHPPTRSAQERAASRDERSHR